jgi:hypothetical protein
VPDTAVGHWHHTDVSSAWGQGDELVRVRTAIIPEPSGGYRALLYPVERPTTNLTPRIYKIADVLAEWRVAERRLVDIDPATDEGQRVSAEVEQLREQYQVLFERSLSS